VFAPKIDFLGRLCLVWTHKAPPDDGLKGLGFAYGLGSLLPEALPLIASGEVLIKHRSLYPAGGLANPVECADHPHGGIF
jgi:hypothetical protein